LPDENNRDNYCNRFYIRYCLHCKVNENFHLQIRVKASCLNSARKILPVKASFLTFDIGLNTLESSSIFQLQSTAYSVDTSKPQEFYHVANTIFAVNVTYVTSNCGFYNRGVSAGT
jgi:hypothetical protein